MNFLVSLAKTFIQQIYTTLQFSTILKEKKWVQLQERVLCHKKEYDVHESLYRDVIVKITNKMHYIV